MSLDLVYERLLLRRIAGENATESVVEGTVTLPDRAGEIDRALKLRATPRIARVDAKEGRVVLEGSFDLWLLYAREVERPAGEPGDEDEGGDDFAGTRVDERLESVSWHDVLPFALVLELPEAKEGEPLETSVEVRSTSFDVRSDRVTVDVDIVVAFEARRVGLVPVAVAKGVKGAQGIEVERRTVRITSHLGEGRAAAEARGRLPFSGRGTPERILEVRAVPVVTETAAGDGVVRVQGHLNYGILYSPAGSSRVYFAEWSRGAAFAQEVAVPSAVRGGSCHVRVRPRTTECRVVTDDAGECWLDVRTPLDVEVQVDETKEVSVVTGLQGEEREIASRRETLHLVEAVGEAQKIEEGLGTLDLPEGLPAIDRLLYGTATAEVDEVHVLGDKVAVELHVDAELVYAGRGPVEGAVHVAHWARAIELDFEVPVRGAEPGLERRVRAEVLDAAFDLINRESVELQVRLAVEVALHREVEVDAVAEAVEVPPPEANPPTYTFVVIRPQDTLWKLAARYRSHPEVIVAANSWLESEQSPLIPGRKLCIPRRGAIAG